MSCPLLVQTIASHCISVASLCIFYCLSWNMLVPLMASYIASLGIFYCFSWHRSAIASLCIFYGFSWHRSVIVSLGIHCFSGHLQLPLLASIAFLAICSCLFWLFILRLLVSSIAPLAILYCLALHLLLLFLASSIDTSHEYMGAVSPLLPNAGRRSFSILTIYFFFFFISVVCFVYQYSCSYFSVFTMHFV